MQNKDRNIFKNMRELATFLIKVAKTRRTTLRFSKYYVSLKTIQIPIYKPIFIGQKNSKMPKNFEIGKYWQVLLNSH